ncbi:MAG: LysR family transcriptional regulator [Geminicoccaceae bacterium]
MPDNDPAEPPPYRALLIFIAAARAGRFADAARRFGITPSAVSHQLRSLEHWVGQPLFEGRGKGTKLTPIGRVLFDGASTAADRLDEIAWAVRRSADSDKIVLSAPPAFASFRLVSALLAVRRNHPSLPVDVRLASFDAAAETDAVDIAIRFLHDPAKGRRLGVPGWSAVCTRAYFERIGRPSTVGAIEAATLVHEQVFNFWPRVFATLGQPVPAGALQLSLGDALSVLSVVLAGQAVGILPREVTRDLRRKGTLIALPGADVEPRAAFHALITPGGARKPLTAKVLETIGDHLDHGDIAPGPPTSS